MLDCELINAKCNSYVKCFNMKYCNICPAPTPKMFAEILFHENVKQINSSCLCNRDM